MTDLLDETGWHVQVSSLPQAMDEACDAAGLSPNAVRFHELSVQDSALAANAASLDWPSYFCDKTGFILVLAYLVRNHLPLELTVEIDKGQRGSSRFRMHPPLDPHSLAMLRTINPRQANAIEDLQDRAETVFARLRHGHLGPPADGA